MKTETRELLGFNVPVVGICETIAELTTASGGEDNVVKDANNQTLAHSHYTILRRVITKTLVQLTGIKMLTKTEGTKEVVVETEGEYRARLETQLGADVLASYDTQVALACSKVPVDYTPGTRGSGADSAPAKKWLAYYDQLKAESKLATFCSNNQIDSTLPEDELKIVVANKVKAIVTAKMAAAAKSALD